jgi:hypothetical protein
MAYVDWGKIHRRIVEMHPDWEIFTITFPEDASMFCVVCQHGTEWVSPRALQNGSKSPKVVNPK